MLNARGENGAAATSRASVTVVEPAVDVRAVSTDEGWAIEVASRSAHELNLGGYTAEAGESSFELAGDTIILPGRTLFLPARHLAEALGGGEDFTLRRPDGRPVSTSPRS